MLRCPGFRIDIEPVLAHHHDSRHVLALLARQQMIRHRRQPDVSVEPDLVAGVAGEGGPAARLADVSDENAGPAGILVRMHRQPLEKRDRLGMAPIAVARQPHHLPGVAIHRHLRGTGDAALGVLADHLGRLRRRQILSRKKLLGADLGILGILQRRQRLRIERALVLRRRGKRAGGCRDQKQDENRAGLHRLTLFARDRCREGGAGRTSQLIDIARIGVGALSA